MTSSAIDRYQYYLTMLHNRDQALVVVAGLVLSALLWWYLLERQQVARRWLSWAAVIVYVAVMAAFILGAPLGTPP